MQNTNQKNIKTVITLGVFILISFIVINFIFTNSNILKNKSSNLVDKSVLSRIADEAEMYYEKNNHYGSVNVSNLSDINNCSQPNIFLKNINVKEFFKTSSPNMSCKFQLIENNINAWSVSVSIDNKIFCVDSSGVNKERDTFPVDEFCDRG